MKRLFIFLLFVTVANTMSDRCHGLSLAGSIITSLVIINKWVSYLVGLCTRLNKSNRKGGCWGRVDREAPQTKTHKIDNRKAKTFN